MDKFYMICKIQSDPALWQYMASCLSWRRMSLFPTFSTHTWCNLATKPTNQNQERHPNLRYHTSQSYCWKIFEPQSSWADIAAKAKESSHVAAVSACGYEKIKLQ